MKIYIVEGVDKGYDDEEYEEYHQCELHGIMAVFTKRKFAEAYAKTERARRGNGRMYERYDINVYKADEFICREEQ